MHCELPLYFVLMSSYLRFYYFFRVSDILVLLQSCLTSGTESFSAFSFFWPVNVFKI